MQHGLPLGVVEALEEGLGLVTVLTKTRIERRAARSEVWQPGRMAGLLDEVRTSCAAIAANARHVRIEQDRLGDVEPGPPPALDPERHYLEGSREDVIAYLLTLDAINFGSGLVPHAAQAGVRRATSRWPGGWPTASGPTDRGRPRSYAGSMAPELARVLGQEPGHELMELYADALRQLGGFLGERSPAEVVHAAGGSAERLAETLAAGMPFFDDRGFWKRAQITANDLTLAGVAEFDDIDRLTIFADNLVPHVLRVDGVLAYDERLAARIDAGELLPPGEEEREIRACAVHACELIASERGVPPRVLDVWLWNRGQAPRYKALPRHRTRTVYY